MVTPGTLRRLVAIPVVAVAGLLVACQPPPAPDGRDLGVTVTDLPDHQTPGTSLDISATVTNHGTAGAGDTRISFVTTTGTFVDVTDTQGLGSCEGYDTQVLTCLFLGGADLSPGSSWTVSGTVRFPSSTGPTQVGVVVGSAGSEPVSDPHPNTVVQDVSVDTTSVVDLEPVGWEYTPGGTTQVGQPVSSYTTVFIHDLPVSGLSVSQTIPVGFQIGQGHLHWTEMLPDYSVEEHDGTCTPSGRTVTCTADTTVRYADSVMMWVDLVPQSAGGFSIGHTASSPHPEPVPDPHPNTVSYSMTVAP